MQTRGRDVQSLPAPALLGRRLAEKAWSLAYDNRNVTSSRSLFVVARDMTTPETPKYAVITSAAPEKLCEQAAREIDATSDAAPREASQKVQPTRTCEQIADHIHAVRNLSVCKEDS